MSENDKVAVKMRDRNCVLSIRTTEASRTQLIELQKLLSVRIGAKLSLAQTFEIVLVEALRREKIE